MIPQTIRSVLLAVLCLLALKLDPRFAEAYAQRGLLRLKLGQESQAQQDFAQAISLQPALRNPIEQRSKEYKRQLGLP